MKKLVLSVLLSVFIGISASYADNKAFMKNMAHANPVPNYMLIIKNNADKLGLSAEQKEKVLAWKKKNGAKMAKMVKAVIDGEKEIRTASMNGTSKDKILEMTNKLMETRSKIITGKTNCRDYMMDVIGKDKWKQLIEIINAA